MLLMGIAATSAVLTAVLCFCCGLTLWLAPVLFLGAFLALLLIAFLFLWFVSLFIDPRKPQEHDSKFHRSVMNLYIEAMVPLAGVKIHTQGMEKTPLSGRFLLVCNHQHEADPVVLLHCFRKSQLAFISKRENNNMFIVGKMMHKTMCQLINRENDREALKTILKCIQLLKEDEVSICAFPEGGIKELGKLSHFRSGMFKIAQKANVPIVVCTLRNTARIIPNLLKLKPTDVHLHLVDVIQPESFKGMSTVELGDTIYRMMLSDLGESFRPEQ